MLSVQGRGLLRLDEPDISGFANVLECASRPFPNSPELKPQIVLDVPTSGNDIWFGLRPGICDFKSPWVWIPSPSPETGS